MTKREDRGGNIYRERDRGKWKEWERDREVGMGRERYGDRGRKTRAGWWWRR